MQLTLYVLRARTSKGMAASYHLNVNDMSWKRLPGVMCRRLLFMKEEETRCHVIQSEDLFVRVN